MKAAVVLSFIRYTEWSPAIAAGERITIGVIGRTSFAATLSRMLDGKMVDHHPIRTVQIHSAAEELYCRVIYFAGDASADLKEMLVPGLRAITIGEDGRFLDLGGAVNLFMNDGRMAFEVNLDAVDAAGCSISAKLLRFGQVRRRSKKGRR